MGFPYSGQEPIFPDKPWWISVVIPTFVLTSGVTMAMAIVNHGGIAWAAIPIAWLLIVNAARTFQVHVCHQGIHGNFSGNQTVDRAAVEVVSTVLMVQGYDEYHDGHDDIHHPKLASDEDPDLKFTVNVMKIKPGNPESVNKRKFLLSIVSPRIHALLIISRLKSNFVSCPIYRRLMSIAWLAVFITGIVVSGKWVELLYGCLVPVTVLYHASAMCQFVTEHFWANKRQSDQSGGGHYLSLLLNRHLGDPLPEKGIAGAKWLQCWVIWWARLLFYHMPVRMGILVADLPVHGSHHLDPHDKGWTNAIYSHHNLAKRPGGHPVEVFGSFGAIFDRVMASFAQPVQEENGTEVAASTSL